MSGPEYQTSGEIFRGILTLFDLGSLGILALKVLDWRHTLETVMIAPAFAHSLPSSELDSGYNYKT